MIGGRIDPSSCPDTYWVDDMAVWWFRASAMEPTIAPMVSLSPP